MILIRHIDCVSGQASYLPNTPSQFCEYLPTVILFGATMQRALGTPWVRHQKPYNTTYITQDK